MAESPAYWGHAERVIDQTIDEHYDASSKGVCGYSLAVAIARALEDAGLMEVQLREEHNHFTREITPDTCSACKRMVERHAKV